MNPQSLTETINCIMKEKLPLQSRFYFGAMMDEIDDQEELKKELRT